MEAIKDTINTLLKAWENKKASGSDNPAALLKQAFTKKELGHIKFNYFKHGVLSLSVDSSVWLYHLTLQKERLLNKLRGKSKAVVKDIRFYLGETG